MNTSFGDLKEIFSTPPTEARYSWVIHNGNQTLEGTAVRLNQQKQEMPKQLQRTNSLNPFMVGEEAVAGSNRESPDIANKRPKTDDETEELMLDFTEEHQKQPETPSSLQRSPKRQTSDEGNHQPARSQSRVRNLSSRGSRNDNENKENIMNENSFEENKQSVDNNSSIGECSSRVFGDNYDRAKRYVKSHRLSCLNKNMPTEDGGGIEAVEYQYKNLRLQEEVHSASKKINKLNQINQNALKRKGELQKEVLDAYKRISELEVSRHSMNEKHREMTLEMKTVKQRIGDAEREAAHAIGCSSKLQRELMEAGSKKKKYFDDLNLAERRINKLEGLMKDLEIESKQECKAKNQLQNRICESEAALKVASNDNTSLVNKLGIKEKELCIVERKLERECMEKQQNETKSIELAENNRTLTDDLKRLESKYEISQRTVEQYTTKLNAEKDKFGLVNKLKNNAENDLRAAKQQIARDRSQHDLLNNECKLAVAKYKDIKKNHEKTLGQNEELQRDNRGFKDRVLYLELYQKISDKKSRRNSGGEDKKRICFLDTLDQIKANKSKERVSPRSRNGSRDSWDQPVEQAWDKSQRVQNAWSQGFQGDEATGSHNEAIDLDRLSEMSAQIEKLQKEQRVLNHVTAESCGGSSKAPSRLNTARGSVSPCVQNTSPVMSKRLSPREKLEPNLNDTMPSFCDKSDDEEERDDEIGNFVTFSDMLRNDNNRDIASALM